MQLLYEFPNNIMSLQFMPIKYQPSRNLNLGNLRKVLNVIIKKMKII